MISCLVTFKNIVDARLLFDLGIKNIYIPQNIPKIALCKVNKKQIEKLKEIKNVTVEVDEEDEYTSEGEEEPIEGQVTSYAINLLEVKRYHNLDFKGQGVKVAIFDSGIQKHEDLIIAGGINAYNQSQPYDENIYNSHGTMVAGMIAAQDNEIGTLGVAPEVELYAVKLD